MSKTTQYTALGLAVVAGMILWYCMSWKPYLVQWGDNHKDEGKEGMCCCSRRLHVRVYLYWHKIKDKATYLMTQFRHSNVTAYAKVLPIPAHSFVAGIERCACSDWGTSPGEGSDLYQGTPV